MCAKRIGYYCRICGRYRANERFSGKGHKIHICKDCARPPVEERLAVEQEDEITGFLKQSNISQVNIVRLKTLAASPNPEIARLGRLVLEIARTHPQKKSVSASWRENTETCSLNSKRPTSLTIEA